MLHADPHAGSKRTGAVLRRGLEQVLAGEMATRGPFVITSRRLNPRVSTYLADRVTVRFADGSVERLLCKYGSGVVHAPESPHRGLAYESAVYDQVLRNAPLSLPHVWGSFEDPATGEIAIVMRYYPECLTCGEAHDVGGTIAAVRWLAAMHAWSESRPGDAEWSMLKRYDAEYYKVWLSTHCDLARPGMAVHPWLDRVADAYRGRIPLLTAARATLVHGEFTPNNALWAEGRVIPIDWETAAIGPAEIDLAVFTLDWDMDDIRAFEQAYVDARWQGVPPAAFSETLLAARLYVAFHWIFSGRGAADEARTLRHLECIREEAVRWGIITDTRSQP